MASVDEAALKAAVKARRQYIVSNLNTMTLKSCRKTLEEDLGLQSGELKPFKDLLGSLIDRIIAKHKAAEPAAARPAAEEEETKPAAGKTKRQPKAAPASDADGDEDDDGKPSKRRKQDKQPAKTSGPRQYSRAVEKLRGICKAATITIPPSLYVKNKGDAALQAALQALLAKHGLDEDAGQNDIQRARNALQVQRDLDGIDTSNIIEGGRRPRRAAANMSFKALVEPDSEEEEEEEEEGSGSEEASLQAEASDEEEAEQAVKAAKGGARASPAGGSDSADEASSSGDESDQESSEGEDDAAAAGNSKKQKGRAPAPAVARSPDENVAARGNASGGPAAGQPARKARPAVSLDDSDGEGAPAAGGAKRRALADWSSDED